MLNLDCGVRPQSLAVTSMMLRLPVPDAPRGNLITQNHDGDLPGHPLNSELPAWPAGTEGRKI
jgi:hypothetical protein